MATASSFQGQDAASALRQQLRRIGPLGFIILLHLAFFYALQSGMWRQVVAAVPHEVFASLIAPQPSVKPAPLPTPVPTPPKVVQKSQPKPQVKPMAPVANTAPAPTAITTQAAPAPAGEASSAPAAAASSAVVSDAPVRPKTVTTGIEYIQAPSPEYPSLAKRMGEEGKVMLRILVNEKGRPEQVDVRTSSGFPRLDEAARKAAMNALFKPRFEDGKPVAVFAIVPIIFSIVN